MERFKNGCVRALDTVLGSDGHMRIRTSQAGLAGLLMLACVVNLHWLALQGVTNPRWTSVWAVFCVAGLLVFYSLIRSGFSLRWADPSLAFPQMLYAIGCNAVAFVIAGPGRGVTLPLLAVILMFGVFGMSMRQVVVVAVYAIALFGAAIWLVLEQGGLDGPRVMYGAYFFMVVIVLSSTTVLTYRFGVMRIHMQRQKAKLTEALETIQRIATRDELTDTANRRSMLEQLRQEMLRSNRTGAQLMVAMLDIDFFKQVNDRYGHPAGDRCLQVFVQTVQSSIRATDRLARWGGEEFVLLLTDVDFVEGLACLERVRAEVESTTVEWSGMPIRLTVSIGVTQYQSEDTLEKTIDCADLALYAAKAQGRNRVVSA